MRSLLLVSRSSFVPALGLLLACGGQEPARTPVTEPAAPATTASTAPATSAPSATTDSDDAGPRPSATNEVAPPIAPASTTASAAAPEAPDFMAEQQAKCAGVAAPYEEKVRAKFNECYQAGKKKNPELAGTIKITLKIDTKGKVTKVVPDPSKLDAKVVQCMVQAVKKEPFDGKACLGKDVIVSKKYGN